jgi:hypothetical protein
MTDRGRLDTVVTRTLQHDLDALPIRARAALRLLTRADAATASQLTRRIYRRERTAQERLLQLMRAGALERMIDPRSGRGTAAHVTAQARRPEPASTGAPGDRGVRESGQMSGSSFAKMTSVSSRSTTTRPGRWWTGTSPGSPT